MHLKCMRINPYIWNNATRGHFGPKMTKKHTKSLISSLVVCTQGIHRCFGSVRIHKTRYFWNKFHCFLDLFCFKFSPKPHSRIQNSWNRVLRVPPCPNIPLLIRSAIGPSLIANIWAYRQFWTLSIALVCALLSVLTACSSSTLLRFGKAAFLLKRLTIAVSSKVSTMRSSAQCTL